MKNHIMMRHIPLILVTDSCDPKLRIEAAEYGVSDYIIKPFEHEEVIARINRLIRDIQNALNANPLTMFPGNLSIHEHLDSVLLNAKKSESKINS